MTTRDAARRVLFAAPALAAGFALCAPAGAEETRAPRRDMAEVFAENCGSCHKADGRGGPGYGGYAANLRTTALTADEFVEVLIAGRQDRGMPTFDGVLEPETMAAVAEFVLVELRDPPPEEGAAAAE